ncbi:MAG: hypothetical protein ACLSDQ_03345 [Adlercreutzia equolifaciens]
MWPIKDGPFYGYPCSKRIGGGSLVATSGLLVTGRQQVQGQGFEPIKGLFACGNTSWWPLPHGIQRHHERRVHRHVPVPRLHVGQYLATEDFDRYCTLGAGNADIKQSDKGMVGRRRAAAKAMPRVARPAATEPQPATVPRAARQPAVPRPAAHPPRRNDADII